MVPTGAHSYSHAATGAGTLTQPWVPVVFCPGLPARVAAGPEDAAPRRVVDVKAVPVEQQGILHRRGRVVERRARRPGADKGEGMALGEDVEGAQGRRQRLVAGGHQRAGDLARSVIDDHELLV